MNVKLHIGAILLAAVLLLSSMTAGADTRLISSSFTVSKGDSKYDGTTYDFTAMQQATGNAVVNIADAEVTGGGLRFLGFPDIPEANVYALNLSVANTKVTDSTITLQGCLPRYSQFYFSNTKGDMKGTTPLFVFTDVSPRYYVIINIVDTTVSWPKEDVGGDLLQIGKTNIMFMIYSSAVYITRANATNAANIWNVIMTLPTPQYFVSILTDSMIAVDYVNCYNCKNAFIYSTNPNTPPLAGSERCMVRYSNCTQTGGKPFYAATSPTTFTFGPTNGNMIFSGITTDGPFFQFRNGCRAQVKRYTTMSFMHINAKSSGVRSSYPFPVYLLEGFYRIDFSHVFMGNVTLAGKVLSNAKAYAKVYLQPKYVVDEYSRFIMYGAQHSAWSTANDYVYAANDFTNAFCAMGGGTKSIGVETLGDDSNGGELWTRPECVCNDGFWAPYCTATYDPLLYYAGYTFNELPCQVENCTQCWWGKPNQCTECNATFMLYPSTWGCVPNICGECPTDDGKLYTYTEGKCVENTVTNCAQVDINSACVSCDNGYTLYNGECVQCNVENCALCSSDNFCYQCNTDQAYQLDSSTGKCLYCGDNCVTCKSSGGCETCATGYNVSTSGVCTSLCSLSGCEVCATSTTCLTCKAGLTLTSAGLCSCNIDHCDTCFEDKCMQCADGYYYNILNYTCDTIGASLTSASERKHIALTTFALSTLFVLFATILV